ncbi:hypothetical protein D3C85_1419100 [compost metagenome]
MPSGRVFIAIDSRPKLMIMKTMVPTVCHGLENPSDAFIRKAQTISNRPARRRKIQAMTVSLAWRAGSSRRSCPERERSSSEASIWDKAAGSQWLKPLLPLREKVAGEARRMRGRSAFETCGLAPPGLRDPSSGPDGPPSPARGEGSLGGVCPVNLDSPPFPHDTTGP